MFQGAPGEAGKEHSSAWAPKQFVGKAQGKGLPRTLHRSHVVARHAASNHRSSLEEGEVGNERIWEHPACPHEKGRITYGQYEWPPRRLGAR